MADKQNVVVERVSALLEELMDLVKPYGGCEDPDCTANHEAPEGPWMISGWVMAIDVTAEGSSDVETWTTCWASKGMPRTQGLGLAATLVDWKGR